ncbi:hypothetical protein PENTCL1PPCAC_5160, partial [Pristionchus entomophagus]
MPIQDRPFFILLSGSRKVCHEQASLMMPNCPNITDGCPDLSQTISRLTIYFASLEIEQDTMMVCDDAQMRPHHHIM